MAFYLMYPPDRYRTTHIKGTFPESHWPLEHTRHQVGHHISQLAHDFTHAYDDDIFNPLADVRETAKNFYIDVELPGVLPGPNFSLQWLDATTLLIQADIKRPEIEKDQNVPPPSSVPEGSAPKDAVEMQRDKDGSEAIHFTTKERRIGKYSRAFHFCVRIQSDKLDAKLKNGLLSVVVPKIASEPSNAKHVQVEHTVV